MFCPPVLEHPVHTHVESLLGWRCFSKGIAGVRAENEMIFQGAKCTEDVHSSLINTGGTCVIQSPDLTIACRVITHAMGLLDGGAISLADKAERAESLDEARVSDLKEETSQIIISQLSLHDYKWEDTKKLTNSKGVLFVSANKVPVAKHNVR